jgi:acetolactate synthase small subunit
MRQTIRVWVEDKPGALMRVAGIVSAKGANIHALTVRPDPLREGASTITIVSDLEPHLRHRVVNEMNRLVNVFHAMEVAWTSSEASRSEPVREDLSAQPGFLQPRAPADANISILREPGGYAFSVIE